jgi:A/G-specific adenine glycosylase
MAALPFNSDSLLYKWAAHDSEDYHHFTPTEAISIRQALLAWYNTNRRKLPWRGDAPPFDGSTAIEHKKQKQGKTQTKVKSFFTPSLVPQQEQLNEAVTAIPVTGYSVWVSEIMLQQTRVEAVIPFYLKWMNRFPTVHDLASASDDDVNSHWAGLGFYRRAKLLHQGSQTVLTDYDGHVPRTVTELLTIPGIGPYTAHAIASIAFDQPVAVVDGNVCRVLSRLQGIANHIKAPILKDKLGWVLAQQIMDAGHGDYGNVNQALMELGATYCAPSGTGMEKQDPLQEWYQSTKLGAAFGTEQARIAKHGLEQFTVEDYISFVGKNRNVCPLCDLNGISIVLNDMQDRYNAATTTPTNMDCSTFGHASIPIVPPKTSKREEVLAVLAISCGDRWLFVKRPKRGLLAGQWEFPSVCVWDSANQATLKRKAGDKRTVVEALVPVVDTQVRSQALDDVMCEFGMITHRTALPSAEVHVFSHVRHTMWIEFGPVKEVSDIASWHGRAVRWMTADDMVKVGVTSGVRKILNAVNDFGSRRTRIKKR